jgi:hypothetical protein
LAVTLALLRNNALLHSMEHRAEYTAL